jgi:hypothetical protein
MVTNISKGLPLFIYLKKQDYLVNNVVNLKYYDGIYFKVILFLGAIIVF